jgi:hypothetical protein
MQSEFQRNHNRVFSRWQFPFFAIDALLKYYNFVRWIMNERDWLKHSKCGETEGKAVPDLQ